MKVGALIRHTRKSEWGIGVVVDCTADKCTVHFEDKGRIVLQLQMAGDFLVEAPLAEVEPSSALLDPTRWHKLALPARQRGKGAKAVTTSAACVACKRSLNRSQYSEDRKLKSCPKCSSTDGHEHVFYEYPDAFGQAEARVSPASPDGVQSYCLACRGTDPPASGVLRCSSVTLHA